MPWPVEGKLLGECAARSFEVSLQEHRFNNNEPASSTEPLQASTWNAISLRVILNPERSGCPISGEDPMHDPVVTVDGQVYERGAIEDWFRRGKRTSPATNVKLHSLELLPLEVLRELIETHLRLGQEIWPQLAELNLQQHLQPVLGPWQSSEAERAALCKAIELVGGALAKLTGRLEMAKAMLEQDSEKLPTPSTGSWVATQKARKKEWNKDVWAMGQIRGFLNKVTPENFELLYKRAEDCVYNYSELHSNELVKFVSDEIFKHITQEHGIRLILNQRKDDYFVDVYSAFFVQFEKRLCSDIIENRGRNVTRLKKAKARKKTFVNHVMDLCEQALKEKPPVFPEGSESDDEEELRKEQRKVHKMKRLATVKFLGHLLGHNVLPPSIVSICGADLLTPEASADELEAMCVLLRAPGPCLGSSASGTTQEFVDCDNVVANFKEEFETEGGDPRATRSASQRTTCLTKDLLQLWAARTVPELACTLGGS